MKKKECPICGSKEWNFDVVSGFSGWTYCGDCWKEAKNMEVEFYDILKKYQQKHIMPVNAY